MKVLVTGYAEELGYDIVNRLEFLDIECKGVDIEDFDILDEIETMNYIKKYNPTIVIHCAEYMAIDRAEENKKLCFDINVNGTKNVAEACKEIDCEMVYISTDYVFNGKGEEIFKITDKKEPCNHYGKTKSEGEEIVKKILDKYYIIRCSWIFGRNGRNFVNNMLIRAQNENVLNVVYDQIATPTYAVDLAKLLVDIIQTGEYGIYHATNEGFCSLYDYAKKIVEIANIDCKINPIKTSELNVRAKRPYNTRLDKSILEKKGFMKLRNWEDALKEYIMNYM